MCLTPYMTCRNYENFSVARVSLVAFNIPDCDNFWESLASVYMYI